MNTDECRFENLFSSVFTGVHRRLINLSKNPSWTRTFMLRTCLGHRCTPMNTDTPQKTVFIRVDLACIGG
jgi:hypothetical protein